MLQLEAWHFHSAQWITLTPSHRQFLLYRATLHKFRSPLNLSYCAHQTTNISNSFLPLYQTCIIELICPMPILYTTVEVLIWYNLDIIWPPLLSKHLTLLCIDSLFSEHFFLVPTSLDYWWWMMMMDYWWWTVRLKKWNCCKSKAKTYTAGNEQHTMA